MPIAYPPQRIIIFDGPDRCGKSNIAQELSRQLEIPYFKASSEHESFLDSFEDHNRRYEQMNNKFLNQLRFADPRMADFLKQTGHSVIFDRAYPSEVVYSTLFHRVTDLDVIVELDRAYEALGAKLVLCLRADYSGITDDVKPDMGPETLREQHQLYMEFYRATQLRSLLLFTDDHDLKRQITTIREFLEY